MVERFLSNEGNVRCCVDHFQIFSEDEEDYPLHLKKVFELLKTRFVIDLPAIQDGINRTLRTSVINVFFAHVA